MPTLFKTYLLLPLLFAACAHAPQKSRPLATAFPKDDPRATLKLTLTALANGQTSTVLAHTRFQSANEKIALQHFIPQARALRNVQHALLDTFHATGSLGDDPLPDLLTAIDNATVRLEPPNLARIIPPPPNSPFTLIAEDHHWKLDFSRTQPTPDRPLSKADLASMDGYTQHLQQLATDIRTHRYPSLESALAAVTPNRHQPSPTTAPALAPAPAPAPPQ